jgi:hypothetical protein
VGKGALRRAHQILSGPGYQKMGSRSLSSGRAFARTRWAWPTLRLCSLHRRFVGFALIRLRFKHRFEDDQWQVKHKHGNILHATTTSGFQGAFLK